MNAIVVTLMSFMIMLMSVARRVPRPDEKACRMCEPCRSSPIIAPHIRPAISPKGGKKMSPISIPITEPHMPDFEIPNTFAPKNGTA